MIRWILNYGNTVQDENENKNEREAEIRYYTDLVYWQMYYDAEGDRIPREWLKEKNLI